VGFGGFSSLSVTAAYRTDKSETLAWQRLDQALFLAGVANCTPGDIQAGRQRCIRHAAPIPNGIDEVVFTDDTLPVPDHVIQQVKYLGRNGDNLRPTIQLAPVSVECVFFEEIAQAANPLREIR